MKKNVKGFNLATVECMKNILQHKSFVLKRLSIIAFVVAITVPTVLGLNAVKRTFGGVDINVNMPEYMPVSEAVATSKVSTISIPSGMVKLNPFVPYRNIGDSVVDDVPNFELIAPPETINENSEAVRIMDTVVSGILYDAYSPSAILNIDGNDHLVKKGDTINNYKVVNITKDCVSIKLGNNTYKAGIGEILSDGTVNENEVSNLNKKFGGERR